MSTRRDTGGDRPALIQSVEDLRTGDHLCVLADTEQEHVAAVTDLVASGLERGERCVILERGLPVDRVRAGLSRRGLDVDAVEARGLLEVRHVGDRPFAWDTLTEDTIGLLRHEIERTRALNAPALRVLWEIPAGGPAPTDRSEFLRRTALVESFLGDQPCTIIGTAPRYRVEEPIALEMIRSHPFIMHRGKVHQNLHCLPPSQLDHDHTARREIDLLVAAAERNTQTRAALQRSEERYRSFIELSTDGIVLGTFDAPIPTDLPVAEQVERIGRDTRIVMVNAAFARMHGWRSAAELEGRRLAEVLGPSSTPEAVEALTTFVTGGYCAEGMNVQVPGPAGQTRHLSVTLLGVLEDDQLTQTWGIHEDVTERVQAEQQRRSLEEQLRHSQKMQAVGQLAGGIAHDFNNLLHGLLGYLELARDGSLPQADRDSFLDEARRAGDQAVELTQQLLAFARRQILDPRPTQLTELVADTLRLVRRLIGEDIQLELRAPEGLPPVHADHGLMSQVLVNLCVNARDAMPRGGRLTIELGQEELAGETLAPGGERTVAPGPYVRLSVSDTGTGLTPEVRQHMFEPFYTTKKLGQGTGLGLAVVDGIVEQHQGLIRVDSEPGRGTRVSVYLPASSGPVERPDSPPLSPAGGGAETILVAEDEAIVRNLASRILSRAGYQVLTADDGDEAVAQFLAHEQAIDLALLDVVMPGKGGAEALEQMRARRPDLKAVFTTGYSDDAVQADLQSGEDTVLLQKPYRQQELLTAIRKVLGRPSGDRS